jgi:ketosteroid isomerase-like protein
VRQTLATDHPQAPGEGGPNRHTSWLTTTNSDGTAHVRPLGTQQIDGVLYFNSGPRTRKSRNIAANPQCVLSIATLRFDLVVEGHAVRVTDATELAIVAEAFRVNGWPAQVDGDALTAEYSAPVDATQAQDLEGVVANHDPSIVMFDVPPYNGIRGIDDYRETWPPFFEFIAQRAEFTLLELDVVAGADVAFAYALLRCGTKDQFDENPDNRLRVTVGLRKADGRWVIAHEHHSFPMVDTAS